MQDSPKRPRMIIETPKSTNYSSEKRLDRYEVTIMKNEIRFFLDSKIDWSKL